MKSDGGGQIPPFLRDVIYGWPHCSYNVCAFSLKRSHITSDQKIIIVTALINRFKNPPQRRINS